MTRITGHIRVEPREGGPVWIAKYVRAEGTPTRKVLGRAWARESGRRTARGAPVWRVADGTKPDGYLSPEDAKAALRELLEIERGKPAQALTRVAGRTFDDAASAWLRWGEHERKWAPSHLRRCRGIVSVHLLPEFGATTPLRRITTPRINSYRERMLREGRLSPRSMQLHLIALSGLLGRARKAGWVAHNAASDTESVHLPKASGDFNVLTPEQVEHVARAAEGDYGAIIRVAAHTGLRLGELRALRWRDVVFADGVIRVRKNAPVSAPVAAPERAPKSGRVRSVPLTDDAARALDALSRREFFVGDDDYVFPSPVGGLIDGATVRGAFYRALDAAGLGHLREGDNPFRFHDLRHTFGTLAVRVFPISSVQAMMGHADVATTSRYLHHSPRHDDARRLSEAFAVEATPAGVEQVPSGG